MKIILAIAFFVQVSQGVVTNNNWENNEAPTTLATDLYKPLTPLKENPETTSKPVVQPEAQMKNSNNDFAEYSGSSSRTYHGPIANSNEGDVEMTQHFPMNHMLQSMGYPVVSQSYRTSSMGNRLPFNEMPMAAFPAQHFRGAEIPFTHQFIGSDPFPATHQFGGETGGNNNYRFSSSQTYFNSDMMNAPITRHFSYDSRNL